MTIFIFLVFVGAVLVIASRTSRLSQGVGGFFAANNSIHWAVNGVAFAGGYLSVASFLGIAGLIAFFGYDGFLYSIGFLAGWIIALFVIAEPMKRMGTFTFSDALNKNFKNPYIRIAAGISVLVVSLFYLVPQMVGAGVLIEPLLGISHFWGVLIVGTVVILIVAGGGMTSTTYVQFFNGGLLLLFALILTIAVLVRGVSTERNMHEEGDEDLANYQYQEILLTYHDGSPNIALAEAEIVGRHVTYSPYTNEESVVFYRLSRLVPVILRGEFGYTASIKGREVYFERSTNGSYWSREGEDDDLSIRIEDWWVLQENIDGSQKLVETQFHAVLPDGTSLVNGALEDQQNRFRQVGGVSAIPAEYGSSTGPIGPFRLLSVFSSKDTTVQRPRSVSFTSAVGERITIYYEEPIAGSLFMRPGLMFPLEPEKSEPLATTVLHRLNFISLMIALFFGTAALPHILIRYYTVPDVESARKSTIIAIAGIGMFYVLTMYLGVGAVISGGLNPTTSNMSAPLLARSFGEVLFAMISAIAFTTVLATTSGLIMAVSGAVAHDLMDNISKKEISDKTKVLAGRIAAVVVGIAGIILGISFRDLNVSFLVGWAFAVAASANLPSLVMMLFWKKVTAKGIIASILTGIVSSVSLILLNPDMWARYGLDPATAPMPLNQPGIISIPLSFIVLVVVSLLTGRQAKMEPVSA
jgi:cation/acetate symporter